MSKRYRVPPTRALGVRVAIETLAMLVLIYPMMHIYIFLQGDLEPYQRGFFCDDENIKHPDLKEEISVGECILIWSCIVVFLVPAIEFLHVTVFDDVYTQPRVCGIPWVVIELYRVLGYFVMGALCTLLTTEMAKYKIGRLRPYFLTACNITLDENLCKDSQGYNIFVTDYHCPGDAHDVREASKSFLSGHSSFSFYCATFLIVHLHARLRTYSSDCKESLMSVKNVFKGLKILRPFLQFGIFLLAFYISLTRISDYKHHPADVVTGVVVGVFFAVILLLFLVDLVNRPRTFKTEEFPDDEVDEIVSACNSGIPLQKTKSEPNLRNKDRKESSDCRKPLNVHVPANDIEANANFHRATVKQSVLAGPETASHVNF